MVMYRKPSTTAMIEAATSAGHALPRSAMRRPYVWLAMLSATFVAACATLSLGRQKW